MRGSHVAHSAPWGKQPFWSMPAKRVDLWGRPRVWPADGTQGELLAQAQRLKGGEVAQQMSITVDSQVG